MQMACHLYIHRNWEKDQQLLAQSLRFFKDTNHTCQVWWREKRNRVLRHPVGWAPHSGEGHVSVAVSLRFVSRSCCSRRAPT